MKCAEIEALWFARDDGRLGPGDTARWNEHLQSCSRCARMEQELDGLEVRLETLSDSHVEAPYYLKTRVMAALAEQRPRARWLPFRHLTSRRLLAVSMACLAFFAGLLTRELHRVNEWMLQSSGVQTVVLEYQAPDARDVNLVGDFNGWGRQADPVPAEKVGGRWVFQMDLKPGRYQYAFVVDGKKWLPDPTALGIIPDGFGGMNSVLYVPEGGSSRGRSL